MATKSITTCEGTIQTKIYQTKIRPAGEYRIYPLNKCLLIKEFTNKVVIDEFYKPSKKLRTYKVN